MSTYVILIDSLPVCYSFTYRTYSVTGGLGPLGRAPLLLYTSQHATHIGSSVCLGS